MRKGVPWEELFTQKKRYDEWLSRNLYNLDAAALHFGDEFNTFHFDWEGAFQNGTLDQHLSIGFLDLNATEYVCCSTAMKLFYQELHEYDPFWIVERIYCPFSAHNDQLMKKAGVRRVSAEGHMPTAAFDILCVSQQMIGDEVNLISMLLEAGIPLDNRKRTDADPMVIRGGASSFNPSVIMDICDLFFIGEGEDILPSLLKLLEKGIRNGRPRDALLLEAVQTFDGLFAPRFYEQRFTPEGVLSGMFPLRPDVPEKIRYAFVRDLDHCFILTKPIGTYSFSSDLGSGVEITKGCEGQCSFCVSGFTYLPFRARSVDKVMEALKEFVRYSGIRIAPLSSFCGASYPNINALLRRCREELPVNLKMMTQRIDSFRMNPEFSDYLTGQGTKRIVFGVEGMSQKLRQSVSKNYTEEQILETVRRLCRSGYTNIKFMLISGLPNESRKDWEELIEFSKRLLDICREEEKKGFPIPRFLYTWTPLQVFPFAPYQWLRIPETCPELPEEMLKRLEEIGIHVSRKEDMGTSAEYRLIHLLLRGDRRVQPLLIDMAKAGILRHGWFTKEDQAFADRWIAEHEIPGYETWFEEKEKDAVFPWDFIDNGVSKEHLWKRYCSAVSDSPEDFPRCLDRCQNCGACKDGHQAEMSRYRKERALDAKIVLRDLLEEKRKENRIVSYAILKYTFEDRCSVVKGNYFDQELARALNLAGISITRDRLMVVKPHADRSDWACGMNCAVVCLNEEISDEALIERVNAHTLHMKICKVVRAAESPRVRSYSYSIPCPQLTSEETEAVRERIRHILASEEWILNVEFSPSFHKSAEGNVRQRVFDLSLEDQCLKMKLDHLLPAYTVYENLLGIGWEEASKHMAVRTAMEFTAGDQLIEVR